MELHWQHTNIENFDEKLKENKMSGIVKHDSVKNEIVTTNCKSESAKSTSNDHSEFQVKIHVPMINFFSVQIVVNISIAKMLQTVFVPF